MNALAVRNGTGLITPSFATTWEGALKLGLVVCALVALGCAGARATSLESSVPASTGPSAVTPPLAVVTPDAPQDNAVPLPICCSLAELARVSRDPQSDRPSCMLSTRACAQRPWSFDREREVSTSLPTSH